MMVDDDATIKLLRSIDATLRELLALSKTKRATTPQPALKPDPSTDLVATDAELDSEHGDEIVKAKMPKDWTGDDFKGAKMSECPPALLDMLASRHEYFAKTNEEAGDKQKAGYERRSARRARGWARRMRAGWKRDVVTSTDIKW